MKTNNLLLCVLSVLCVSLLTGCGTSNLAAKFAEFEKLGITEAQITGKFSSTTYTVEKKDGTRTATFDHTNAWLPKVKFIRKTEDEKK